MKPHSIDLRQRIVESYEAGEGSIRQLAKRYKVGPDAVRRLLKRYRETGSVNPLPQGGSKPPKLTPSHLDTLKMLVEEDNDATLAQLAQGLEQRTQLKVSTSTISRGLSRLEITRKKKSEGQ
ncbi:MAG: transposase [Cyanobacteria bacterium P01_F01_bin.150]